MCLQNTFLKRFVRENRCWVLNVVVIFNSHWALPIGRQAVKNKQHWHMSRIGKQPIVIPEKTSVTREGDMIVVKGPLGELKREFLPDVAITIGDGVITLAPADEKPFSKILWGTYASHLRNMITGVNVPFKKALFIEGVGFRAEVSGKKLVLSIGFSHKVEMPIPEGIAMTSEKGAMTITGIDKELVGQFAAKVRAKKKPEPYKGKGIRYEGEVIRRKQGKKTA